MGAHLISTEENFYLGNVKTPTKHHISGGELRTTNPLLHPDQLLKLRHHMIFPILERHIRHEEEKNKEKDEKVERKKSSPFSSFGLLSSNLLSSSCLSFSSLIFSPPHSSPLSSLPLLFSCSSSFLLSLLVISCPLPFSLFSSPLLAPLLFHLLSHPLFSSSFSLFHLFSASIRVVRLQNVKANIRVHEN